MSSQELRTLTPSLSKKEDDEEQEDLIANQESQSFIEAKSDEWKFTIDTKLRVDPKKITSTKLRKFYEHQNGLIDSFEKVDSPLRQQLNNDEESSRARIATNVSLIVNICLLIAKLIVAFSSGSLAVSFDSTHIQY